MTFDESLHYFVAGVPLSKIGGLLTQSNIDAFYDVDSALAIDNTLEDIFGDS